MIYTKQHLLEQLEQSGLLPTDTVFIHSSMKAMGQVEGGADTVIDALMEYFAPGLLALPTHSWDVLPKTQALFDPAVQPACVGILPNIFRKRPGVVRSLHPSHSVAAFGKDAAQYTSGEENNNTPCARNGCMGKLIDRDAKIMFLGCPLSKNTFIHGVEEWNDVPDRLSASPVKVQIKKGDELLEREVHYHHVSFMHDLSQHYIKLEPVLLETGVAYVTRLGDARCVVADARRMEQLVSGMLKKQSDLFKDLAPIPRELYT